VETAMDESSKLLLTVAIPTVTVLIGILVNNRKLEQLERHFTAEIAALRSENECANHRVA
jgi:hypothetical protein